MRVLTVFAHPGKRSFCHSVLERFDAGLREAGHANEVLDLYRIKFDPVLRRDLTGCDFGTAAGVLRYIEGDGVTRCGAMAREVATQVKRIVEHATV